MAFRVGMKVVCVDDSPDWMGRPIFVTVGSVYTVTDILERYGEVGILLLEIEPGGAPGWLASRFRQIVERKTDISFTTGADPDSERWDNRVGVDA